MKEEVVTIHKGEVLLVRGPASAKSFQGKVFCLAKDFKELIIRKGKALPIETFEESASIKLLLYEDATYEIRRGDLGYAIWAEEIEKCKSKIGNEYKKIMILGPTDSGKSTLAVLLSNIALSMNKKVGILDGDVGQADLTPPAFIGCKILKEGIFDLRDVYADFVIPIGLIDVSVDEELIIKSMKKALEYFKDVDTVIINTDGYIEGPGIAYKIKLIKEMNPNAIFLIGNEELKTKFSSLNCEIVNLKIPPAIGKDRTTRVLRREMQYAKFISTNSRINIDLKTLSFGFLGRIYKNLKYELGSISLESEEGYKIRIFSSREFSIVINEAFKTVYIPIEVLEGMLVGLEKDGNIVSYGMIEKIIDSKARIATSAKPVLDAIWLTLIRFVNNNEQKIKLLKI
ncbi:MAG: Clp1/GlmU family protein [Thermoproteota archaeon]|nr:Clp1/GlmU family protein [Thermoproteota archaeon]